MLEHGGQLHEAARQYHIPVSQWLDLSTGINPHSWPVPAPPSEIWSRLPQNDDELETSACRYYASQHILPVAGSQAAIQALPRLRPVSKIAIVSPTYAEHARAWQQAGHDVMQITSADIPVYIRRVDVLLLVNPNNPTGETYEADQLLNWHSQLATRDGWLIVDEAFIDATPENSLAACSHQTGLVVLRSLGKFFGLPGARVGFVLAQQDLLVQLGELLGPWTLTPASRWIAQQALNDYHWQLNMRQLLRHDSRRLAQLLNTCHLAADGGCALFQWVSHPQAAEIHHQLAKQGILLRLFKQTSSLRFGLPATETDWQRLQQALATVHHEVSYACQA